MHTEIPMHLVTPQEAQSKEYYLSSDFWFYKGVVLSQKE